MIKSLKVIKGGKGANLEVVFVKALVTQTRLMGTIALKIVWTENNKPFVQWFILDAEDHGIFDYEEYKGNSSLEEERLTQRFMGHLGGRIIDLKEKEALYLVQFYSFLNKIFNKELPRESNYSFILNKKLSLSTIELEKLNRKIFEEIDTVEELLHYFVMRAVGNDSSGLQYLLSDEAREFFLDYKPVSKASVLLKNEIKAYHRESLNDSYITRSIVDTDGSYSQVVSIIGINEGSKRIIDAEVASITEMSPEEVAEEIKRPEYIRVYRVEDWSNVVSWLNRASINLLNYEFQQGRMLVEFRKSNNHVKRKVFQISGDILAIYFINKFNQFILCYYSVDDLQYISRDVINKISKEYLKELCHFQLKASVIYEYAEMQEMDFLKYIKEYHLN